MEHIFSFYFWHVFLGRTVIIVIVIKLFFCRLLDHLQLIAVESTAEICTKY